ncbi:hypothetical protein KEH51_01030 [[Brevibacterium] frigoritolerans]|uniref:FAD/NAD(P)-binding domain-containing protein n=1 Tax=Peribacillus frigoritolerans TaxID=450367 RepID=A0A941FI71_9BACI|nr:hypothetical protein [Peribacillus frigoritolerans]
MDFTRIKENEKQTKCPRDRRRPGGLQAAITADSLGHSVTLIDQSKSIGGLLRTMRKAPMRHELAESMLDNYSRKLMRSNINVQLGKTATAQEISESNPDAIICATGSRPLYTSHRRNR